MREYNILSTIVLGFLTLGDYTYEMLVTSADGHIKINGTDIILVDHIGVERPSYTPRSAIDIWLSRGCIEPRSVV